ncbi:MAG: hypothetical protein ACI9XK_001128 [Granulosicoccus sp.]
MAFIVLSGCTISDSYEAPPIGPLPTMPVPVGPASNVDLSKLPNIVFSWERMENAVTYEFHIYNALNADIDKYMVTGLNNDENCHQNVCAIQERLVLPDSRGHAWWVRALNVVGISAWARRPFTWDMNCFL